MAGKPANTSKKTGIRGNKTGTATPETLLLTSKRTTEEPEADASHRIALARDADVDAPLHMNGSAKEAKEARGCPREASKQESEAAFERIVLPGLLAHRYEGSDSPGVPVTVEYELHELDCPQLFFIERPPYGQLDGNLEIDSETTTVVDLAQPSERLRGELLAHDRPPCTRQGTGWLIVSGLR